MKVIKCKHYASDQLLGMFVGQRFFLFGNFHFAFFPLRFGFFGCGMGRR